MFEHVWLEETCSWILASGNRIPDADGLKKSELYFVWGLLMNPRFVEKLTGSVIPIAPAFIRGYRRETFVAGGQRGSD